MDFRDLRALKGLHLWDARRFAKWAYRNFGIEPPFGNFSALDKAVKYGFACHFCFFLIAPNSTDLMTIRSYNWCNGAMHYARRG